MSIFNDLRNARFYREMDRIRLQRGNYLTASEVPFEQLKNQIVKDGKRFLSYEERVADWHADKERIRKRDDNPKYIFIQKWMKILDVIKPYGLEIRNWNINQK